MEFADRLKQIRKENYVTQKQLASDIHISRSSIAGYEVRDRFPDYDTLIKLALYFNVSTDWFLGISDSKEQLHKSELMKYNFSAIFKEMEDKLVKYGVLSKGEKLSEPILSTIITHGLESAIEILKLRKGDNNGS